MFYSQHKKISLVGSRATWPGAGGGLSNKLPTSNHPSEICLIVHNRATIFMKFEWKFLNEFIIQLITQKKNVAHFFPNMQCPHTRQPGFENIKPICPAVKIRMRLKKKNWKGKCYRNRKWLLFYASSWCP